MKFEIGPRGILQIDDARIVYRNFSGAASKYNREGDRNFAVVIPNQDMADELIGYGWNVRIKPPRDRDDDPFMYLPVKIKFSERGGPRVYLKAGKAKAVALDEESVECLDHIDILSVSMDLRPYDWEVSGKTGRTAYLQAIHVEQNIDRFAARFAEEEYPVEDDLPF